MSEALRDRLLLFIPYAIASAVSLSAILFLSIRTNSWQVWFCLCGLPTFMAGTVTWLTPLRTVQLRHLKRRYPKPSRNGNLAFSPQKQRRNS